MKSRKQRPSTLASAISEQTSCQRLYIAAMCILNQLHGIDLYFSRCAGQCRSWKYSRRVTTAPESRSRYSVLHGVDVRLTKVRDGCSTWSTELLKEDSHTFREDKKCAHVEKSSTLIFCCAKDATKMQRAQTVNFVTSPSCHKGAKSIFGPYWRLRLVSLC